MHRTVWQLGDDIAEGRTTSEALVRRCIDAITAVDPTLHAFVEVFEQSAIEAARRSDDERRRGTCRGPLHGIPVAVKSLADIKGHVTGFGSRAYGKAPALQSAAFVSRLVEAGAVIVGTTQMVEFAMGSWGTNYSLGTPWNPVDRNLHRVPGGSSSGSAVAVAAGLVPAAIGSDTGGSIRIPASLCGVVGFKPTWGAVSNDGVAPLAPTLDTIGPITNDVEDARLIYSALADAKAPDSRTLMERLRIGVIDHGQLQPLDRGVEEAFARAVEMIAAELGTPGAFRFPTDMATYQKLSGEIIAYEGYQHLAHLVDDPDTPIDPYVRDRILAGRAVGEARYQEVLSERATMCEAFRQTFEAFDFLLLPTTPLPAVPLAEADESQIPMSRLTRVGNYLGLCAISIPIGNWHKLPVGLQILGRAGDDLRLLSFAAKVEAMLRSAGA